MKQDQNKRIKTSSLFTRLFIFFVFMGAFWGLQAPFASASDTQFYPDILANGSINNLNCPSYYTNPPYITSFSMYSGIYPDTSHFISGGPGAFFCNNSGNFLEGGYNNGATTTNDGDYWVSLGANTDSYYFRAVRTGGLWYGFGVASDTFQEKLFLPDNTEVASGYDYTKTDYGNIKIKLIGTNSIGLYDNFYVDVYEDGTKTINHYTIPISYSCVDCELGHFLLSDTGQTFQRFRNYKFFVTMGSILAEPITQQVDISYDMASDIINYDECSTGDIFCYVKNAFRWAFTVPPSTFNKFVDLRLDVEHKPPFGYITGIYDVLGTFNNTTTGVYTLVVSSDINTMIFAPIKTGIAWVLYIVLAIALLKRFKDINV